MKEDLAKDQEVENLVNSIITLLEGKSFRVCGHIIRRVLEKIKDCSYLKDEKAVSDAGFDVEALEKRTKKLNLYRSVLGETMHGHFEWGSDDKEGLVVFVEV